MASRTRVTNVGDSEFGFPAPYSGVLAPGAGAVLAGTPETVIANLGGLESVGSFLKFDQADDQALSPQNSSGTAAGSITSAMLASGAAQGNLGSGVVGVGLAFNTSTHAISLPSSAAGLDMSFNSTTGALSVSSGIAGSGLSFNTSSGAITISAGSITGDKISASQFQRFLVGSAGTAAGVVTLTGSKVADTVETVLSFGTAGGVVAVSTDFEATISVADQIQQTGGNLGTSVLAVLKANS